MKSFFVALLLISLLPSPIPAQSLATEPPFLSVLESEIVGFCQNTEIPLTEDRWTLLNKNSVIPGGIIRVVLLPLIDGKSDSLALVSISLYEQQLLDESAGFHWMYSPTPYKFNGNDWAEAHQESSAMQLSGRICARQLAPTGNYIYVDKWTYRGSPGGWLIFQTLGRNVEIIKETTHPKDDELDGMEENATAGKISKKAFEKWKSDNFICPDGFRIYNPTVLWTSVAEIIKKGEPEWRDSPIPETAGDLSALKEKIPPLGFKEFEDWCKAHSNKASPN